MAIKRYAQLMIIDTKASLPSFAENGDIAYAQDVKQHFMFDGTNWTIISGDGAWVQGVMKTGTLIFTSMATTVSGSVTFWLTDNGTSTGNAVFSEIYPSSVAVSTYGSTAQYQTFSPVIASDRKSITVQINQVTAVLLGLLQFTAAANGVDVRLIVLGKA
jgi:hypothetical protein